MKTMFRLGLLLLTFGVSAQNPYGSLRDSILQQTNAQQNVSKQIPKGKSKIPVPVADPIHTANAKLVFLEQANTLSYDEVALPGIQVLRGEVRFRQDNALMYCDSAYFYENANSMDAFGNVRMEQGDTLFVYGDYLFYDGNTRLARLRRNVKLINRNTTLVTDSLNFDRNTNLAYYYTGGKITDPENTLTSVWGQYNTASDDALFRNTVKLLNTRFTLDSDTLKYNTKTNIANIVGKTHIIYQNETDVYTRRGWYNTNNEQMMLLDRSLVVHKDGKTMIGDTIFYDKKTKFGEGFVNVELTDSVQKSTLYGDYVFYNERDSLGIATDSALLVDWSSADTLWVHADTLNTFKDSIYNAARGINNVRIYRHDLQGICDSLTYTARDSIMNLYGEPVLWTDNNQLSGDFIQAFTKNQKVERVDILHNAIASQQDDSIYFNQLSGKEIVAYIDSGELRRVHVNGNAETIYITRNDSDYTVLGINKTISSYVFMYLKDKKIERIVMPQKASGVLYPEGQLAGGDLYLKNFFWLSRQRPASSSDVLIIPEKEIRNKIGTSSTMDMDSGNPQSSSPPPPANKTISNARK
ncbi:MAG: hypothetical protein LBV75_05850 [Paludibacter sp.]|jgi:lipopolysaccharide export system protein LptA|nr:hypothetical protein [Paludibacter sp.]